MRSLAGWACGVGAVLLTVSAGRAADAGANEVIDRAIAAHGGAERLRKLNSVEASYKGTVAFPGTEATAAREAQLRLPGRMHWKWELDIAGRKSRIVLAVNPDRGWRQTGGPADDMAVQETDDIRAEAHAFWLTTLLPLKGDSCTCTKQPDAKVNGKEVAVVKVGCKRQADVYLSFDKGTGLLVKMAFRGRDAGLPVQKEFLYSDHKAFAGIQMPTRQKDMTGGRQSAAWTVTDYRFPDKIDDKVFEKP